MLTKGQIQQLTLLVVLVALALSGCGTGRAPESTETAAVERTEAGAGVGATFAGEPAREEAAAPAEEKPAPETEPVAKEVMPAAGSAGDDEVMAEVMPLPTAELPAKADAPAADMVESDRAVEREAEEAQQTGPLKAGEVNDNARWDDYLLYRRNYSGPPVHHRDVSERYIIQVQDGQGLPVLGATVRFFLPGQQRQEIYTARTYADGRALFHPLALAGVSVAQADRFLVEVEKDNVQQQFTLTRFSAQAAGSFTERWTVTLDARQQFDSTNLDVLFLIDATGSMADEIAKIQNTIFDVAARIDALPARPNVRYGMVTYRDREDSFVTNTFEFTPNVEEFYRSLSTVFADGGGDYPESLNEGLHQALHGVEWRGGQTVQLVFLIADAPPHLDYAQDYDYAVEMETAARRGIKIFPIASSGLDDQGEYIFRQIAQYTQGRFIFLTYQGPTNGGAPGDVTTHHVEDYSVDNLDDLLVRLVEEELAHQTPQLAQAR